MSIELLHPITLPEPAQWEVEEPRLRRLSPVEEEAATQHGLIRGRGGWTAEQYEELGELGVIGPEERVELIDGEILEMSPQRDLHADGVMCAFRVLQRLFEPADHLRPQLPLRPSQTSEPEPDIAVIAGSFEESTGVHPSTALLVVEVSDTTLRFDQEAKASLYAAAGVRNTGSWISVTCG
jgi:Uma2 family endonuclease